MIQKHYSLQLPLGLSFDHKRELISALLRKVCEDGRLLNFRWDLFRYYDKLKHPEIADQLKPYLVDKHKAEAARDIAVDIGASLVKSKN